MNKDTNVTKIRDLGRELRVLFRKRYSEKMPKDVSRVEGRFLGYIYDYQDEGVISSDLVRAFQLKKSTVSETLSSLQRKGFIEFAPTEEDRRKKIIRLGKKGMEHQKEIAPVIEEFDSILDNALSEEEQAQFEAIYARLMKAMKEKEEA